MLVYEKQKSLKMLWPTVEFLCSLDVYHPIQENNRELKRCDLFVWMVYMTSKWFFTSSVDGLNRIFSDTGGYVVLLLVLIKRKLKGSFGNFENPLIWNRAVELYIIHNSYSQQHNLYTTFTLFYNLDKISQFAFNAPHK